MFPSRHASWLVKIRYGWGFSAARRALNDCKTRVGETPVSPTCLDLGPFASEAELRNLNPQSYDCSTTSAVMGITVLGDGIGKG